MSDIKLFVSCHKDNIYIPESALLQPIQVGAAKAKTHFEGMLHDDTGDNISLKNSSYCEGTGQYWAWKNADADYYGFFHYRRYFNFSDTQYPTKHEPFIFGDVVLQDNRTRNLARIGFNDENVASVIENYDFIASQPTTDPFKQTIYQQYCSSVGHHKEDLDTVLDIVAKTYPDISKSVNEYMNLTWGYFCNMFIMRKDLFQDYSAFLFDVLAQHEQLCDFSDYAPVDARVSGYLAERLCGAYLYHLTKGDYAYTELQRVYFRDTDKVQPLKQRIKNAVLRR